jgi:hypothetical protein
MREALCAGGWLLNISSSVFNRGRRNTVSEPTLVSPVRRVSVSAKVVMVPALPKTMVNFSFLTLLTTRFSSLSTKQLIFLSSLLRGGSEVKYFSVNRTAPKGRLKRQ